MNFRQKLILISFLFLFLFWGACKKEGTRNPSAHTFQTNPVQETIVEGLKRPWSMVFLSEKEVLLSEKDGDLLKINLHTKAKEIIGGFPVDMADSLVIFADQYPRGTYPTGTQGFKGRYNAGIFDVVLDPEFKSNNWVYIAYASEKEKKYATKVIRAKLIKNRLENIEELLLALPYADGLFHFGGGLLFGEDGKLYVTMGERLFGDALQPELPIAQDLSDARGKIYRINKDGSIPEDNPEWEEMAVPGIYGLGIRNAQGMAMDPLTGNIWFTEHGTIQGDELNMLQSGANYGWPVLSTGKYRGGYVPPKLEKDFELPKWSWYKTVAPTGLTFYNGSEFPQWKNNLIVPGLSRGNLWRFVIDGDKIKSAEELFVDERVRLRKAINGLDGHLYVLSDEDNGRIIRINNSKK